MNRIDIGRYRPDTVTPGAVVYSGQKTAREVFNELQQGLKAEGYLPDEYFLLNYKLDNGEIFPVDAEVICNVNWGNNEGIFLNILLKTQNKTNEPQYTQFATGKTLGESESDLDRMYLIASACTKAFHMPDIHNRYILDNRSKSDKTTAGERLNRSNVIHLNENEKKLVTDSLIEMRTRYKAEKKPLEEIERLLRRIIGTIAEYIKAVGEWPQNLDFNDIATAAVAEGNRENFTYALPHVPHLYGNLLNEAINRSDESGWQMAFDILESSNNCLSNDIYNRACATAIRNKDMACIVMLIQNAERCVNGLDKRFYGNILQQTFSNHDQAMAKAIINEMTANQVRDTDPHILKLALLDKSYDVAKELIYKGIDVSSASAMLFYTVARQKNIEMACLLQEYGADPDGQYSAALEACMQTNDIQSAMFLLGCGADFNMFMEAISDKYDNGKLSDMETAIVMAIKVYWENVFMNPSGAVFTEDEIDYDMEP